MKNSKKQPKGEIERLKKGGRGRGMAYITGKKPEEDAQEEEKYQRE